MNEGPVVAAERTIRRYLLAAVLSCCFLVGGVGGLAAMIELAGAVIASGTLVVDSRVKKVQHPSGGVVDKINVREGDIVKAGDVLVRLDETVTRANLAIVEKSLDEFYVRVARLEAERDGKDVIDFSATSSERRLQIAHLIAGEQSLFMFRRQARLGQKSQLRERISQIGQQIAGLTEQSDAKHKEIELIGTELDGVRKLWDQKLVSMERMTSLEREAVRLGGEHGQLTASIAQAKGQVTEVELQIIQIDQDMRSEVATELRDAQAKIAELVERKVAAEDALNHVELRSPQDGVVHELSVHTIGGVIAPAEIVMLIVPVADKLMVEARVAPQDIDQVVVGQNASLHLSAFSRQTTPELNGVVRRVAADLTVDQSTGVGFYGVRLALPVDEIAKLNDVELTPGMPVEVFFSTSQRTILSYLVKPLTDQVERAFREE